MKGRLKTITSMLTAAAMLSSFAIAACVTAGAEGERTTKLTICASSGEYDGVWGYRTWNWSSTLHQDAATNLSSDAHQVYTFNPTRNAFGAMAEYPEGVTPIEECRYRLIPLLDEGSNIPAAKYSHAFREKISDFGADDQYISLDMIKANGYNNSAGSITEYRIGLAYIDFSADGIVVNGANKVYPTDIAWYDVTEQIKALNSNNSGIAWDELKTTVSVKVADILDSSEHQYLHGATSDVTADNANAVVFGFVMPDKTKSISSNKTLAYDELRIESIEGGIEVPTPVPTIDPNAPGTKLKIATTSGEYDGVYGYRTWNWANTLHQDVASAATKLSSDGWPAFTLNPTKVAFSAMTDYPEGVTPMDESRYRILPLLTEGNNSPSASTAHTFIEKIPNFGAEDQYLCFDMIKANGFRNSMEFITNYKVGLAYIDYDAGGITVNGSNKVYPTDIAWYDITDKVETLNFNSAEVPWDELKTTISVKISDILDSNDHQYLHGMTSDISADNANAVVFGFVMPDVTKTISSNKTLAYDDLRIDVMSDTPIDEPTQQPTEAPTPVPNASFSFSGSIADGVKLTADNPGEAVINPVVVTAYYKDERLIDIAIDSDFAAVAGNVTEKTYTLGIEKDYDRVSVMVLESMDNIKPLCTSFYEVNK